MRRLSLLLAVQLACQLWMAPSPALGQPSWEQPTPDACLFDPALNGEGFVVISPNDGFQTDRVAFDAQGRLYLNLYRVVDNHHYEDRIRRYLPNGEVDTTWGINGIVDLPGEMFSGGSRTMAVDDLGRLWFARASYLNFLVVERFLSDGSRDRTLPVIEWHLPLTEYDRVGDMTADGNGVVLAYGTSGGGAGSMLFRRIDSGGVVTSQDPQIVWPALEPVILDVRADGWVAGAVSVGDGPLRAFVWSTSQRGGHPYVGDEDGFFYGINGMGATATAYGTTVDPTAPGALVRQIAFDANLGDFVSPAGAPTSDGTQVGGVAHLDDEGGIIGLAGEEDELVLYIGELGSDFTVTVNHSLAGVAESLAPLAVRELADGSTLIAGWHDYVGRRMFIARLAPPTMGAAVSDTALRDQLLRLYQAYFKRQPDQVGMDYWLSQRAGGLSIGGVSDQFATSPEFIDRYGPLSHAQFVRLVYDNVLGRPGESAGISFWTEELEAGRRSRGQVMLGFSESPEFVVVTETSPPHSLVDGAVSRLYRAYFGRAPDENGLCFWSRRLVGGLGLGAVSDSFASSAEFAETYGALSDQAFVELVYNNVLGRAGEAEGVAFWTDRLSSGVLSRGQIMTSFSESPEFILSTGTLPG